MQDGPLEAHQAGQRLRHELLHRRAGYRKRRAPRGGPLLAELSDRAGPACDSRTSSPLSSRRNDARSVWCRSAITPLPRQPRRRAAGASARYGTVMTTRVPSRNCPPHQPQDEPRPNRSPTVPAPPGTCHHHRPHPSPGRMTTAATSNTTGQDDHAELPNPYYPLHHPPPSTPKTTTGNAAEHPLFASCQPTAKAARHRHLGHTPADAIRHTLTKAACAITRTVTFATPVDIRVPADPRSPPTEG